MESKKGAEEEDQRGDAQKDGEANHNITTDIGKKKEQMRQKQEQKIREKIVNEEEWWAVTSSLKAESRGKISVLLHNGGFCNNCTPKRCLLHISVHFQTNSL